MCSIDRTGASAVVDCIISVGLISRVFEHSNFATRCRRETNHITVARVAPLVAMTASM